MKYRITTTCLCLAALLTGCSQEAAQQAPAESTAAETTADSGAVQIEGTVYYLTDHGTTDVSQLKSFCTEVQSLGYTWQEGSLDSLTAEADTLILNTPQEDLTADELTFLNSYLDTGGHILLLMPAQESETRYKYLERLLEAYRIRMDYDLVTETDTRRISETNPELLPLNQVAAPSGLPLSETTAAAPAYLHNARSFHMIYQENTSDIKQDAAFESAVTAVGTPCGGTEDDPETFEEEQLITALHARDDTRKNSIIFAIGASDFLLDTYYTENTSLAAHDWVMGVLYWFAMVY